MSEDRAALDAAVREYETALADKVLLERRLAQLQQTIGSLCRLCGFEPTVPFGLTDACRAVLRSATRPVTALDVRDRLTAMGFDVERYANSMATIHTVLRRLCEAGEADAHDLDESAHVAFTLAVVERPAVPGRRARKNRGERPSRPGGSSRRRVRR